MFAKLFLYTTDPHFTLSTNILLMIILSIIVHTILYTSFCNITSYIFFNKILSNLINMRLIISLFFIMSFGYVGRILHSKEVYNDFNHNSEKTRNYLNQHYNSWIFFG
jgi:hypothetical protein